MPYFSLISSMIMKFNLPSSEQVSLVEQFSRFNAEEALVGCRAVQPSEALVIMAELEIVEHRQKRHKRCDNIKARVDAGLQIVRPNGQKRTALLAEVAAFAHQADAGDQALIAADERVEIGKQRPANVVLQVR